MPVLIYEGPELNQEQRKNIIKGLTDVACSALPDIPRNAFYVFLREYPEEKVGVGGLVLPDYIAKIQKNNRKE
jgi:phenylpyruvate tautomerase PptA (4-oxalocrotonate tautomerase family)